MASFNSKSFENKLKALDASQTAIQTLSLWIIHHRKFSQAICEVWLEQVKKESKPERRLVLFYLANDVVQNGRKKAKELIQQYGKVFYEALALLGDEKIRAQVLRVLNIWAERSIFESDLVEKLKQQLDGSVQKTEDIKVQKPAKEEENVVPVAQKAIPPDFKVSKLLVAIKKNTMLDSEVERKHKKMDELRIDASSLDSIRHVKDRSSVGKFFKQFEESKVMLEGYCHSLGKCSVDKRSLMELLEGGDAFYAAAQEEAKVIINAYKTFGNRLSSMKKKLDSKIKKLDNASDGAMDALSYEPQTEPVSDDDEKRLSSASSRRFSSPDSVPSFGDDSSSQDGFGLATSQIEAKATAAVAAVKPRVGVPASPESKDIVENSSVQDMDLESDSGDDSLPEAVAQVHGKSAAPFVLPAASTSSLTVPVSHTALEVHNGLVTPPLSSQDMLSQAKLAARNSLSQLGVSEAQLDTAAVSANSVVRLGPGAPVPPRSAGVSIPGLGFSNAIIPGLTVAALAGLDSTVIPAYGIASELNLGLPTISIHDPLTGNVAGALPFTSVVGVNAVRPLAKPDIFAKPSNIVTPEATPECLGDPLARQGLQPTVRSVLASFGMPQPPEAGSAILPLTSMAAGGPSAGNLSSEATLSSGGSTPVQDEDSNNAVSRVPSSKSAFTKERPLQNLIDSLFPMLSKSLQTIQESQTGDDKGSDFTESDSDEPSVSDAMSFALGEGVPDSGVPKKKSRFASNFSNDMETRVSGVEHSRGGMGYRPEESAITATSNLLAEAAISGSGSGIMHHAIAQQRQATQLPGHSAMLLEQSQMNFFPAQQHGHIPLPEGLIIPNHVLQQQPGDMYNSLQQILPQPTLHDMGQHRPSMFSQVSDGVQHQFGGQAESMQPISVSADDEWVEKSDIFNSEDEDDDDDESSISPDDHKHSRHNRSKSPADKKSSGHRSGSSKKLGSERAIRDERRPRESRDGSSRRSPRHEARDVNKTSHRSSREERVGDRRRSSRRSPSPHRRRSRGHRSSSLERERKRRHSPEKKDTLFYNNRRSPTPEMDATLSDLQGVGGSGHSFSTSLLGAQSRMGQPGMGVVQSMLTPQPLQLVNTMIAGPLGSSSGLTSTLLPQGIQVLGINGPRLLRPVTPELLHHMASQAQIRQHSSVIDVSSGMSGFGHDGSFSLGIPGIATSTISGMNSLPSAGTIPVAHHGGISSALREGGLELGNATVFGDGVGSSLGSNKMMDRMMAAKSGPSKRYSTEHGRSLSSQTQKAEHADDHDKLLRTNLSSSSLQISGSGRTVFVETGQVPALDMNIDMQKLLAQSPRMPATTSSAHDLMPAYSVAYGADASGRGLTTSAAMSSFTGAPHFEGMPFSGLAALAPGTNFQATTDNTVSAQFLPEIRSALPEPVGGMLSDFDQRPPHRAEPDPLLDQLEREGAAQYSTDNAEKVAAAPDAKTSVAKLPSAYSDATAAVKDIRMSWIGKDMQLPYSDTVVAGPQLASDNQAWSQFPTDSLLGPKFPDFRGPAPNFRAEAHAGWPFASGDGQRRPEQVRHFPPRFEADGQGAPRFIPPFEHRSQVEMRPRFDNRHRFDGRPRFS